MKFQTSIETWAIQPHRFLQAFSQPGNQEHQLWSELCRISLERKQDPLKISMEELVSLSQLDEGQIRELFSMAVRNGSVEKHSSDNGRSD